MFDEIMERQKLVDLDLTEDVVEMIIKKKRSNFEQKQRIIDIIPKPEPAVIEPTFYPPNVSAVPELVETESESIKGFADIVIEIQQQQEPPKRHKLPWQRKK